MSKTFSGDRDNGEGGADDGDQTSSNVVGSLVDVEAGHLNSRQDAADNQRR